MSCRWLVSIMILTDAIAAAGFDLVLMQAIVRNFECCASSGCNQAAGLSAVSGSGIKSAGPAAGTGLVRCQASLFLCCPLPMENIITRGRIPSSLFHENWATMGVLLYLAWMLPSLQLSCRRLVQMPLALHTLFCLRALLLLRGESEDWIVWHFIAHDATPVPSRSAAFPIFTVLWGQVVFHRLWKWNS